MEFENGIYHLRVYGANGFFREFNGSVYDPLLNISCEYQILGTTRKKLTGNIGLTMRNEGRAPLTVVITDHVYKSPQIKIIINPAAGHTGNIHVPINLSKQFGWYDFSVKTVGYELFKKRYAGRAETGEAGWSDTYMGRVI